MLSASIGEGFPYADVAHMGMAFVAIADGDAGLAPTRREASRPPRLGDASPVRRPGADCRTRRSPRRSRPSDPRPVVLLDVGDNVGAGTPGDSAILLEALIRNEVPSFLATIWDAEAVRRTSTVGARVDLEVGGKTDPLYGPPVRIQGVTRAFGRDAWEDRRASGGWVAFDAEEATVVDLDGGGTVLLTTKSVPGRRGGPVRGARRRRRRPPDHRVQGGLLDPPRLPDGERLHPGRHARPGRLEHEPLHLSPSTTADAAVRAGHDLRLSHRPRGDRPCASRSSASRTRPTRSRGCPPTTPSSRRPTSCAASEIVERFGESLYTIAGYLQAARELGFEAVPLMWAQTGPLATITKDAYDRLTAEMFGMLRDGGPWDGVLIANHGAAVSEEFPDMDAAFAEQVRAIVGPDVPIGGTLDMHGNVSKRLVEVADITMVWRTNPHLDAKPRSRKCAELIYRTAKGEIRPVQWVETPPLVVNIVQQFTGDGADEDARRRLRRRQRAARDPRHEHRRGLSVRRRRADGDGLDRHRRRRPRRRARGRAAGWRARAWEHRAALNTPVASIREALEMAVRRYRGPRAARRRRRGPGRRHAAGGPARRPPIGGRPRSAPRSDRADGRRRQHRRRLLGRLDAHPGRGAADGHHARSCRRCTTQASVDACVAAGRRARRDPSTSAPRPTTCTAGRSR